MDDNNEAALFDEFAETIFPCDKQDTHSSMKTDTPIFSLDSILFIYRTLQFSSFNLASSAWRVLKKSTTPCDWHCMTLDYLYRLEKKERKRKRKKEREREKEKILSM